MPHPEREYGLQIQLSTALKERDEARAINKRMAADFRDESERRDAAESALAAARRECEAMRAILVSALYEDGYCEMTTSGKLLEPQGHAPGCDSDPPHRCVCWVMKAYALAAPAAAAGEEGK